MQNEIVYAGFDEDGNPLGGKNPISECHHMGRAQHKLRA
jgi:hypothetical protein